MRIVIDMNLSPQWLPILKSAGHEPIHWSLIGAATAVVLSSLKQFEERLNKGALLTVNEKQSRARVLPFT